MRNYLSLFVALVYILSSNVALAQTVNFSPDKDVLPTGSEYMFKNLPDEPLMSVQVLGAVRKPGIYHIPQGTDMVTLLSLTGGVFDNANLDDIMLRKNKQKQVAYYDLNRVISQADVRPASLDHGDVLFVDLEKPMLSTNTVTVITVTSILLTSILTAITIRDSND